MPLGFFQLDANIPDKTTPPSCRAQLMTSQAATFDTAMAKASHFFIYICKICLVNLTRQHKKITETKKF